MKASKQKFKKALACTMALSTAATTANAFTMQVQAAVPDYYIGNLKTGMVLSGNTPLHFNKINGKAVGNNKVNVTCDNKTLDVKAHTVADSRFIKCEKDGVQEVFCEYSNCIYKLSDSKNGFDEFTIFCPASKFALDNEGGYSLAEGFDQEEYLRTFNGEEHTYFSNVESYTEGDVTYTKDIRVEIPNTSSEFYVKKVTTAEDGTITIKLASVSEKTTVYNVYEKQTSDSAYEKTDTVRFDVSENTNVKKKLTEMVTPINNEDKIIGWELEKVSDNEYDAYAKYAEKTEITKDPESVTVSNLGVAKFEVEANGTDLQYKWFACDINDQSESLLSSFEVNGFKKTETGLESTNHNDSSTSTAIAKFSIDKDMYLSFKYDIDSEINNADSGIIQVLEAESGRSVYSFATSGEGKDNIDIKLTPGNYVVKFSYTKDHEGSMGEDRFIVEDIRLHNRLQENDTVVGTKKTLTLNSSNENFVDGKLVYCQVTGADGNTVESQKAVLTIKEKELSNVSAKYVGKDVFVGNTFNSNDVKFVLEFADGTTEELTDEITIKPHQEDGEIASATGPIVTKAGENLFDVTYGDYTATVSVWGYDYDKIEAEYTGKNVFVGNQFHSKDVSTYLVYTPFSDGTIKKEDLGEDQFTIVNADSNPNPTVTKTGDNKFTVNYKNDEIGVDFSDDISVWGYDYDTLEATYNGPDIVVDNEYDVKDVDVKLNYTERTDNGPKSEQVEDFKVNSKLVKAKGENTFTATSGDRSAKFTVNGYDPNEVKTIVARYVGDDILVGKEYDKKDVEIVITYMDGRKELAQDFKVNSVKVSAAGANKYTATVGKETVQFEVWGYKLDKVEATYMGSPIVVGNDYKTSDVQVTAKYTPYSNGKIKVEKISTFKVDSTKVEKVGKNTYTATCEEGKATFEVSGISSEAEKTDAVFEVVAKDKDGKAVEGVVAKYTVGDKTGEVKSGSSAKIGKDTKLSMDNIKITLPSDYKLKTSSLDAKQEDTNTRYILNVVVEKQTANKIKVVAVDQDGKSVEGVSVKYAKDKVSGTVTSGKSDTAQLEIGTEITLDNCEINVPEGYTLQDKKLDVSKSDTNQTFTITVKVSKNKEAEKETAATTSTKDDGKGDKTPQTGDSSHLFGFIAALGASVVALFATIFKKKEV